jgi:hypothetical protein
MMLDWSDDNYAALVERSEVLFNNKHLLPVAAWVAECKAEAIKAREVGRGLSGRVPDNKVLEILGRLRAAEVLHELPHPGAPHPRIFEKRPGAFWRFVEDLSSEVAGSGSRKSGT